MNNTNKNTQNQNPETFEREWNNISQFFPYDEPRDAQKDGMKTALKAAKNNGYLLMEGACGTGKTLTALSPFLSLVRQEETPYERIVVATSVKQQQRAFEEEVDNINANLESASKRPISALSLVGKADVCPYVDEEAIGDFEIYGECSRLRKNTSNLVKNNSDNSRSAGGLVSQAKRNHPGNREDEPYYVFDNTVPTDSKTETDYCPYYAQHLKNKGESGDDTAVPFDTSQTGLLTSSRLLQRGGELGTCPHSVMGEALSEVELVIANYYHVFEPTTVEVFTEELLDETSLLIIDEAHNLVPRIKKLLNEEKTLNAFEKAIKETEQILPFLNFSSEEIKTLKSNLSSASTLSRFSGESKFSDEFETIQQHIERSDSFVDTPDEFLHVAGKARSFLNSIPVNIQQIEQWIDFLDSFNDTVDRIVTEKMQDFSQNGEQAPYEFTIPLRDPERPDKIDKISQWMRFQDNAQKVIREGQNVGSAVVELQKHIRSDVLEQDSVPEFSAQSTAVFIDEWQSMDETQTFRTIEMERRTSLPGERFEYDWQNDYSATLTLFNCIPRERISDQLKNFGAGILMSATLEPMHVYRQVTGLNKLEASGTPVYERQYGLNFPEINRMSFTVDAPAFKYNNKKSTKNAMGGPNTSNSVRDRYAQAIFSVVKTTPGRTLVCMPSYSEAWWAGKLLRNQPELASNKILIDEASTNQQTEQIKQEFFSIDSATLVTGSLGTLTEGVDYKGDRLSAVVCCGVPIQNTNNVYATATRTAYEKAFGEENGFEYAFTVPAVRKTRQALGRVIRSETDVGVRVLVDRRYRQPERYYKGGADWENGISMLKNGASWRAVRNRLDIKDEEWDNVYRFLSSEEQKNFQTTDAELLFRQLRAFWQVHDLE